MRLLRMRTRRNERYLPLIVRKKLIGNRSWNVSDPVSYTHLVSSNFGNVLSVLAASVILPFLPMAPLHLILLNLIYDISCTAISWDRVDPEELVVPRHWNTSGISRFIFFMGPVSSDVYKRQG